jgi:hypothetical protein
MQAVIVDVEDGDVPIAARIQMAIRSMLGKSICRHEFECSLALTSIIEQIVLLLLKQSER